MPDIVPLPAFDDFPIEERIVARHAAACGLEISIERGHSREWEETMDCIVFRGAQAAFAATGLLSESELAKFPKIKKHRRLWLHGVIGHLHPESADCYRFVLERINCSSFGKRRNMQRITTDADSFTSFKAQLLRPVEGLMQDESL